MGRIADKSGQRFGLLTVLQLTGERNATRHVMWRCRCDCGTLLDVSTANLRNDGKIRGCGCLVSTQDGLQAKYKAEYDVWNKMLSRCYNTEAADYSRYGGRGIRVCKRWKTFANFVEDMCPRPAKGLQLDRRDNDGGYSPKNCRWVTPRKNSNNRRDNVRITYNGKTKTLSQWARRMGIRVDTLSRRIRKGWSIEDALETPVASK